MTRTWKKFMTTTMNVTVAPLDFNLPTNLPKPECLAAGFPYWIADLPCDLGMTTRAKECGVACAAGGRRSQVRANPALL